MRDTSHVFEADANLAPGQHRGFEVLERNRNRVSELLLWMVNVESTPFIALGAVGVIVVTAAYLAFAVAFGLYAVLARSLWL